MCNRKSLTTLPFINFTSVRVLSLEGNNINLLENDSFVSLTELYYLSLSQCRLRTIDLKGFNGLTKLTHLFLEDNTISEILSGTFENMNSLEVLDLSYNIIQHLDSDIFRGLINLNQIGLRGNKIEHLENALFSGLVNLKKIFLEGNKIKHLESALFSGLVNLEVLYLGGNGIEKLENALFSGLVNLKKIGLLGNKIKHLENALFSGLVNLEEIYLGGNGIENLENVLFSGLVNLKKIGLEGNKIKHLESALFRGLVNLEEIYLGRNGIDNLENALFSGLVNLKVINFVRNKLQHFHSDMFLGLPNLQKLNLGRNDGLQIPTDRNFIHSHSLSHLNISSCNIRSLSVETFANVSALEQIDLSYNNLRTVDINILRALPELSTLYLHGNPLQCDCQLQDVWRCLKERNIDIGYVECETQSEVMEMGWGMLEKGQCSQDIVQYCGDYKNTSHSKTKIWEHENEYDFFEFLKLCQLPVYVVPFIVGTTGNIILLIIIVCNKDMRTVPNMYILNLAISDIIFLTVLFSEACVNRISDTWLQGDFMCTFLPFCRRMSVGLSAYSLALYSIQRYRVTMNAFHVRASSPPTWRVTAATFCGVWIVAALFAVPSAISNYLCKGLLFVTRIHYYHHVVIFELLVSCVLPLCVIAFTYIMTARHLVESSRSISEGTQNPQLNTRRNTAKIVVGLTVVFLISYVPYHVFWTYIICTEEEPVLHSITDILASSNYKLQYTYLISTFFLLINSCLNPVALFCTSSSFRQHLKSYLTCLCKTNSAPSDLKLTRRN